MAEVVRAARAEKITDVTEMPKNLSDRNGLRVQVRCKRGGNVTKLVADLMRHTSLRITVGINLTVLADGVPRQLGLLEVVDRFVGFRFEVVTKRLEHERAELLRELHRLVALLAALDAIDEVIRIVRSAEDDDDAREQLKSQLKVQLHGTVAPVPIDDEQAQFILDMPIKRLSRLNRFKLQEEREAKGRRVDEIGRILDSYDELRGIVVGELRETAAKLGSPRRTLLGGETRVAAGTTTRKADVAIVAAPRTDVVLFATRGGACAVRPLDGRVSRVPLAVGAGDAVATAVFTDTESELNAYTSDGQVLRVRVADIPIESRVSRGTRAAAVSRGSELVALLPIEPDGGHILIVTERGEVKRSEAAVYAGSHMGGSPAIDLPDGDRVVAVVAHGEGDEVLLHSAHGRTLRFAAGKVRPVKSAARRRRGGHAPRPRRSRRRGRSGARRHAARDARARARQGGAARGVPAEGPGDGGRRECQSGRPEEGAGRPRDGRRGAAGGGGGDGADGIGRVRAVRRGAARAGLARRRLATSGRRRGGRRGRRRGRHPARLTSLRAPRERPADPGAVARRPPRSRR